MQRLFDILFLAPLPDDLLELMLMIAGVLVIVGGIFPKARALAGSLILFVVAYLFADPLVEVIGDFLPLWALWVLLAVLLMNFGCELLVMLGYFRHERSRLHRKRQSRSNRRGRCLTRIVFGVAALPFRLSWRLLQVLFRGS